MDEWIFRDWNFEQFLFSVILARFQSPDNKLQSTNNRYSQYRIIARLQLVHVCCACVYQCVHILIKSQLFTLITCLLITYFTWKPICFIPRTFPLVFRMVWVPVYHGSNPSEINSLYFNLISRAASGGIFLFYIYNKPSMCYELWRREAQSKVTVHRALISLTTSGKLKNYKGSQVQTTSLVRSLSGAEGGERACVE